MEKDQLIWNVAILLSIIGLVYVGSQGISGQAVTIKGITCTDSDGGKDIEVYGTCMDDQGMHLDTCGGGFGQNVVEYYCIASYCTKATLPCSAASLNPNYDTKLYYPRVCQSPGQCGKNPMTK